MGRSRTWIDHQGTGSGSIGRILATELRFCPDTPPITRGWVAMYIIRGVIINGPYPTGEYVSFPSPRRSGTSAPAGLAEHAPDLKAGTGAGF